MKTPPRASDLNTDEDGFPDTQIYHRHRRKPSLATIHGSAVPREEGSDSEQTELPRPHRRSLQPPPVAEAMPDVAPKSDKAVRRRKGITAILGTALLAAAAYATYYTLVGSHYESTDNAYVQGNLVQITPQVSGMVMAIAADDTDFVKAGQTLVTIDPADAKVAQEQAEAQLAQTVREVRALYANNETLGAQVSLREADLARAKSEFDRIQEDVRRRAPLVATGAVGKEEFSHANAQLAAARSTMSAAQSAVLAAREQLSANKVLTDGTSVARHPNVQRAAAKVREAYLAFQRTQLPAPVDGFIAKRSVQVGQRVAAGAPLMSVVPLHQVWVDANFKESQLQRLRIGQTATLVADVYGKKVEYHGTILGLAAGTGAAFSLLPAQNATGNWIKIVQRVPVRIAIDESELQAHPLRIGLSMEVTVDVRQTEGQVPAAAQHAQTISTAALAEDQQRRIDAEVQRVINANLGAAPAEVPANADAAAQPATTAATPATAASAGAAPAAAAASAPVPAARR